MTDITLDVTRLVGRLLLGRLCTGIDRVTMAYVRYFRTRAKALIHMPGRWMIFDEKNSAIIFDALLSENPSHHNQLYLRLIRTYVLNWRNSQDRKSVV